MLKNKSILITGGTGSFGQKFVEHVLDSNIDFRKVLIFSRDELKQQQMFEKFKKHKSFEKLRFLLGDIRDKDRLQFAFNDIDMVVHAAALKQVPAAEYNPFEFIKTNIIGAQNLIDCSLNSNVTNFVALSTDKASSPINLYGATKLCSDKLFISAQNTVGKKKLKFSVVRYGNVMGSRGSVLPIFLKQKKQNIFTVTHKDMTRFNISLKDSVKFVLQSLLLQIGGEIFVPKLKSFRIIDLCHAIKKNAKINFIGIRPGEKMHEELISSTESSNTYIYKNFYVILSTIFSNMPVQYKKYFKLKKVENQFVYNSLNNREYLSVSDLKKIIKSHE